MTSKPRHLHIASLVFFMFDILKRWIIPIVIIMVSEFNRNVVPWIILWIVMIIVLVIGGAVIRYMTFTYQLLDDEIVVSYGVFVKKVNHVPYDRIQNVTTNQWFFLQPFHLEELEIETAGHSEKPEVQLKAVPDSLRSEINDLRHANTTTKTCAGSIPEINEESKSDNSNVYAISWHDLIKFALTSPAFLTGLLVVMAGYGKIQGASNNKVYENIATEAGRLGVLIMIGLLVAVLLIFYIVSVIVLVVQYYHFKLTEEDGQFIMERGLLQRRRTTIKMDRIQAVMIKQPWLRSFLKIVTVQLVIISNSKKGDSEKDIIVMPVIPARNVDKFLQQFFGSIPVEKVTPFKSQKRTYWYDLRNASYGALLTAVPVIGLLYKLPWVCLTVLLIEIILWLTPAYFSAKRSMIQILDPHYAVLQKNSVLTKQTYFVPKNSVQFIERRQSIWLKKKSFASLTVNVRSGANDKKIRVNYQTAQEVDQLVKWYKG